MALSFWWNYWAPGGRRGRGSVCPSVGLTSNLSLFFVCFFQTSHLFWSYLSYLSCFLWKFQIVHVLEMLHHCLCQTQQQQRDKEGNSFKDFVNLMRWMGNLVSTLSSLLFFLHHLLWCKEVEKLPEFLWSWKVLHVLWWYSLTYFTSTFFNATFQLSTEVERLA